MNNVDNNPIQEQHPDFDKAEMELIHIALKRTYKERFEMMMQLMKNNLLFKKAKITQYKYPTSGKDK